MSKALTVGVVGATGAVGKQLLSILEERKFPMKKLVPFASARSVGKEVRCGQVVGKCDVMKPGCFQGVDMVFFDASDAVSKEWVPQAAEAGAWVVDNSATFRMDPDVPLLVPEVNGHELQKKIKKGGGSAKDRIFAGPNCSTVQLVVALKPIHDGWGLERVVVSTYQSVSGAGAEAVNEMLDQTRTVLDGGWKEPSVFPHRIAFNCIPHIGGFRDDGYTSEEHKMLVESRRILGLPDLRFNATTVRIPTVSCHSESVNVELKRDFDIKDVRQAWLKAPGIEVLDDTSKKIYPMPITGPGDVVTGGTGKDPVYVGRLRRDPSIDRGLCFWVVSDNLRKGAALNAVQIGEMILHEGRS
ncbi:MAG TPA: aspartate-semialdehyde dehydrogenase [Bdellovibrionota bacterium]|jgi:aspartate-semialdehyde dehydrogenase|nr:aspartate-semialdehyde dehydrogenase [Bdellovibrionota bacterium]